MAFLVQVSYKTVPYKKKRVSQKEHASFNLVSHNRNIRIPFISKRRHSEFRLVSRNTVYRLFVNGVDLHQNGIWVIAVYAKTGINGSWFTREPRLSLETPIYAMDRQNSV